VGPSTTDSQAAAATSTEPSTRKRASSGLAGKLGQEIEERARAQREGRVYDGPGASTWIKTPAPSDSQPAADSNTATSITPSTSTRDIPASNTAASPAQTGGSPYGTGVRASESSTSLNRPPSRSGGGLGGLFKRKSRRVSTSSIGGSTTNLKASESTASLIDPTSDAKPVTTAQEPNSAAAVNGNVVDGTSDHSPVPAVLSDDEPGMTRDATATSTEKLEEPAANSASGVGLASKPASGRHIPCHHNIELTVAIVHTQNQQLAQEIEDRAIATEDQRPASTHTSEVKQPSLAAEEATRVSEDKPLAESTETAVVPTETTSTDLPSEGMRPRSDSVGRNTGSDAGLSRTPSKSGGGLGGLFRRRSRRLSKASLGGSTTNLNASTTSLGDGSAENTEGTNKSTVVSSVRPRTPPFRSRRNTLTDSAAPATNKEAAADPVAGETAPLEREVAATEPAGESTDVFAHNVPAQEAGLEPREVAAEPEIPSEAAVTSSTDDTVVNGASTFSTLINRISTTADWFYSRTHYAEEVFQWLGVQPHSGDRREGKSCQRRTRILWSRLIYVDQAWRSYLY
jgi:hypothetical protein